MAQIIKVVERNESDTVVDVILTVRTVIREGRDVPDMSFNGVPINDEDFAVAVHAALDDDPILATELARICGE